MIPIQQVCLTRRVKMKKDEALQVEDVTGHFVILKGVEESRVL